MAKGVILPAAVASFLAMLFLTTPEIITQIVGFTLSFGLAIAVLMVVRRLVPIGALRTGSRTMATWLLAVGSALIPYVGVICNLIAKR